MRRDGAGSLGIVGATGAVGGELLAILGEREWPSERLVAFASDGSVGRRVRFPGGDVLLRAMTPDRLAECSAVAFCADAALSARFVPIALAAGAYVVDNSAHFRMRQGVPLVVPECNAELLRPRPRLVANPNCATILMLCALQPLRAECAIAGITVTTYQSVSGAGRAAIDELHAQAASVGAGRDPIPRVFAEPCYGNVFVHESAIDPASGFNGEELKIVEETRKIWCTPGLRIFASCARVPVERAHTLSLVLELEQPISLDRLRAIYRQAKHLEILDDWERGSFPTPLRAAGADRVQVGRLRVDPDSGGRRVALWVCGDQLRKGAALNAWQILERVWDGARG